MTSTPGPELPETLTRLLRAPRSVICPPPGDANRSRLGRPRHPSRAILGVAILGVWLWACLYNVAGFAILATLWRSMG